MVKGDELPNITREYILEGLRAEAINLENSGHARIYAWKTLFACLTMHEKIEKEENQEPYRAPDTYIKIIRKPPRNSKDTNPDSQNPDADDQSQSENTEPRNMESTPQAPSLKAQAFAPPAFKGGVEYEDPNEDDPRDYKKM